MMSLHRSLKRISTKIPNAIPGKTVSDKVKSAFMIYVFAGVGSAVSVSLANGFYAERERLNGRKALLLEEEDIILNCGLWPLNATIQLLHGVSAVGGYAAQVVNTFLTQPRNPTNPAQKSVR
jgi:hypothetical protein